MLTCIKNLFSSGKHGSLVDANPIILHPLAYALGNFQKTTTTVARQDHELRHDLGYYPHSSS